MAEEILRNRSSGGNRNVLSLSLSAKNCRFFFRGGPSVNITQFHFARYYAFEQKAQPSPKFVSVFRRNSAA
jgi:hypothetical protein